MRVPMIHYLDIPPEVLADEYSVVVDIYTETPGGQDDDGNPIPPQKRYHAQDATADLQPKSGSERAAQSATTYDSTHTLFLGPTNEPIPTGATVDVKDEPGGSVVAKYTIVFPASWGTHWQLDVTRDVS